MEGKTLAVLKQPVASNIVRGIFYAVFAVLLFALMAFMGEDFFSELGDNPLYLIIPLAAVGLLVAGIGNVILAIANAGFKENPIIASGDTVSFHGNVLGTPLFSPGKIISISTSGLTANWKLGSPKGAINPWWKLILENRETTARLRILKFKSGSIEHLVRDVNELSK